MRQPPLANRARLARAARVVRPARPSRPLGAACLALAIGCLAGSCSNADAAAVKAAPRISDSAFEAQARLACAKAVKAFDTATTLSKEPTNAESANLLDAIDQTFSTLVAQLRQIPVTPADDAAVKGWLADWDSYVAFGHTYAAAVRTGTERDLVNNDSASQGALRRRLRAFAVANHMPSCRFP